MTRVLDVKGMQCPLPVLRTQKELRSMDTGEEIEVLVTDPASTIDMPHFCSEAGHALLSATRDGNVYIYTIQKGEREAP